jgi:hypothetical protein
MSEADVRLAALAALEAWSRSDNDNSSDDNVDAESSGCPFVHSDCAFCIKTTAEDGRPAVRFGRGSQPPVGIPFQPKESSDSNAPTADYVKVLAAGQRTAASCQVTGVGFAGFLVLLRASDDGNDDEVGWKCISAVFSTVTDATTCQMLPSAFAEVAALTMGGYCVANRACDGALMAAFFHETCRLTFVKGPPNKLNIFDAPTFCQMVEHRYESPMHAPYAHLQHETALLSQTDSLLAVDFCTPDVALVTLRVGHPPFLWTDVLTCAKLPGTGPTTTANGDHEEEKEDGQRWWIVAKSSESEPFLLDQARPVG